jgi:hypothetical protein
MRQHVFHTKHDFTPEFAWAAFQLLVQSGPDWISATQLQELAQVTASPLVKRADLRKLLGSMQELGLVERRGEGYSLSAAGECLERNVGRSEIGFRNGNQLSVGVHRCQAANQSSGNRPALRRRQARARCETPGY